MPLLTRLGLLVFVLGGAADILVHLSEEAAGPHVEHTPLELDAHLVTFVGMVLILGGVVVDGVRLYLARRQAERSKGVA